MSLFHRFFHICSRAEYERLNITVEAVLEQVARNTEAIAALRDQMAAEDPVTLSQLRDATDAAIATMQDDLEKTHHAVAKLSNRLYARSRAAATSVVAEEENGAQEGAQAPDGAALEGDQVADSPYGRFLALKTQDGVRR